MTKKARGLQNCKKANVLIDGVLVIIVIFAFAVLSVVAVKIFGDVNTNLQASDQIHNTSKAELTKINGYLPTLLNNVFLFILIFIWVATVILAFLVDTQPVFFVISIVLLAIVLLLGMLFSNVYEDITSDVNLSSAASNFSYSNWAFNNMHIIALVMGFSIILALYAKNQFFTGGGGGL